MNSSRFSLQRGLPWVLLCLLLGLSANPVLAQETTSELRVNVIDEQGNSMPGVPVRVIHVPTQRVQTITSNDSGTVLARGLAIGGPYRVISGDPSAYISDPLENIYVALDVTEVVNLGVVAVTSGDMEEVMVIATQRKQDLRIGAGSDFSREKIDSIPSVARDFVSTIATDPSILVDNSVARGPAVSIAGQNFRYNSVTIDGVAQNDNFGLSKNASATQRSPISIDAIEEINVNVAPFDVTYGGFIGGNINIVTKSGTNEFHGGVFAFKTDDEEEEQLTPGRPFRAQCPTQDANRHQQAKRPEPGYW